MTGRTSQFWDCGYGWHGGITRPLAVRQAGFRQSPQPGQGRSARIWLCEPLRMQSGFGSEFELCGGCGTDRMARGVRREPESRLRRIGLWADVLPESRPAAGVP